jgi:hypothetical protein
MTTSRTGASAVADVGTTDTTDMTLDTEQQHPLAEAGQEATEATGRLVDRATSIGFERADEGRHRIADGLDQAVSRIRQMSTEMEEQQPMIAQVAGTAADGAERVAQYLHTTDTRQMLHSVEDLARRQPILFLGAAFVAGVAASRVIKAAGGGTSARSSYDRYATGYGPYTPGAASAYEPTGPGATGSLDVGTGGES